MHALTEMTRQLRSTKKEKKITTGLILANGGVLTYQHVVCLSSSPRRDGSSYPSVNPLPAGPLGPEGSVKVLAEVEGVAVIEVRFCIPTIRSFFPLHCRFAKPFNRLTPSTMPATALRCEAML